MPRGIRHGGRNGEMIAYTLINALPEEVRQKARLLVVSRAHDVEDARVLLQVLGLIDF